MDSKTKQLANVINRNGIESLCHTPDSVAARFAMDCLAALGKAVLDRDFCYNMSMEEARRVAARCWCQPETQGIEMDVRLAEEFAKTLYGAINGQQDQCLTRS